MRNACLFIVLLVVATLALVGCTEEEPIAITTIRLTF